MNFRYLIRTTGVFAGVAAALLAMPAHAQLVKIDGSSTVFPITEAMAEDFQKSTKGKVQVTVGISGTGGGFKKFCRGETDISDASRPILKSEMEACKAAGVQYYELPIAYDALTVVDQSAERLDQDADAVPDLKKMWEPAAQNKLKTWKQVNPAWPDQPLKLFGPGADSGTFDYFTEAVNGKAKSSRGDYTASEDDNVLVQGVSRDVNALGYFGYAYYIENKDKLKAVPIVTAAGQPGVEPSHGKRDQRQVSAAVAADLHLRQREVLRAPRSAAVRRVLHEALRRAGARSQVRPAARQRLRPQPRACSPRSSSAPSSAAKPRSGSPSRS